jgi:Spy/CpxP family protein refolding chaperone
VLQAKRTLINAVHADAPDEVAIRAAADALGRSIGDAAVVLVRVKTEILQAAALTPEQTRKVGELMTSVDASIGSLLDSLGPPAENPR